MNCFDFTNMISRLDIQAGELEPNNAVFARNALDDILRYHWTGRSSLKFDHAFSSLNEDQQRTFIRHLGRKMRSADKNVSLAKWLLPRL